MTDFGNSKLQHELSLNEKRVLLAISELGGKATPEAVIEQALPPGLNHISSVLKTQLNGILEEYDRTLGDSKVSEIMLALVSITSDNEKQLEGEIITTLVKHVSHILVELDVPLQRKILGRILGEIKPAMGAETMSTGRPARAQSRTFWAVS